MAPWHLHGVQLRSVMPWLLAFVIATVLALSIWAFQRWRRRQGAKLPPEAAQPELPEAPQLELPPSALALGPRLIEFDAIAPCHPTSWRYEDQPEAWQAAMAALGARLEEAQVAELVFVHGTLVGDDPWTMTALVPRVWPRLQRGVGQKLQQLVKTGNDRVLGDLGNYTREYVELCRAALGGKIACSSFVWSSANHHLARVRAAVALIERLAATHPRIGLERAGERTRVLILGHSHAGQVFALVTQLLAGGTRADALLEATTSHEVDERAARLALERVRELALDLVTLGMSPRYEWGDADNYRVLHLLNYHAGLARQPGDALLPAARGDYVQRFGSAGSDFPAWTEPERRTNHRLDELLGPGANWKHWLAEVRTAPLLTPRGITLLVQYRGVSARPRHKLVDSYFGHGVYTRKGALLFTLTQIADFFYPLAPAPTTQQSQ